MNFLRDTTNLGETPRLTLGRDNSSYEIRIRQLEYDAFDKEENKLTSDYG